MPDQPSILTEEPAPRPLRLFTFSDLDLTDPAIRRGLFTALGGFARGAEALDLLAGDAAFYQAGIDYRAHGQTPNAPMPPEALRLAADVLRDVVQRVAIGMPAEGGC